MGDTITLKIDNNWLEFFTTVGESFTYSNQGPVEIYVRESILQPDSNETGYVSMPGEGGGGTVESATFWVRTKTGNSTFHFGTVFAASVGGNGDVVGPAGSVGGNVPSFADATGKLLDDSGIAAADIVEGPASAIDENIVIFDGPTGKLIRDSGISISSLIVQGFPDLALWLDANDPLTILEEDTAGFVSKWIDKSGNGNDVVQVTGSIQPRTGFNTLNGKNVIAFDGDDFMEKVAFSASINTTIFIVTKIILANNTADSIFAMQGTNDFQISAAVGNQFFGEFASSGLGATTAPKIPTSIVGIPSLLNYRLSANDSTVVIRLDGTEVANDTYNGALSTSLDLTLAVNRALNNPVEADIAEVVIYNRDLTVSEMFAVENLLISRWGI